jgi:diguanylate cyclase (GGDEF)-like protein
MDLLVGVGALILVVSIVPCVTIIRLVHDARTRLMWIALTTLVVLFVAGYGVYLTGVVHGDSVVPIVFLFGALFVFGTVYLSLDTIRVVGRVSTLEEENITDALMGIYNRRYFDRRVIEEFARARRYGEPLSILMFDIDHFKGINDTCGHATGDEILRRVGVILLQSTRETDIPARIGGDEVAVIVPGETIEGANRLGMRILETIRNTEFANGIRCTVSMGGAEVFDQDRTHCDTLERADSRMYDAKQAGRDRFIGDTIASPRLEHA